MDDSDDKPVLDINHHTSQARCQPWAFIAIWKPILSGYLHHETPVEFMNFYLLLNALSTY
jgi:hypothetical protein